MIVPNAEELDEIANLIGGCDFDTLGPEARIQIATLAFKGCELQILDDIEIRLGHVSIWFEKSRLYEP